MYNYPVSVHVSVPIIYRFDGWIFEYSRTKPFGPWPLKKSLEPKARAGRRFYKMLGRFLELSELDQEDYILEA